LRIPTSLWRTELLADPAKRGLAPDLAVTSMHRVRGGCAVSFSDAHLRDSVQRDITDLSVRAPWSRRLGTTVSS
jgi:hypothetical protein